MKSPARAANLETQQIRDRQISILLVSEFVMTHTFSCDVPGDGQFLRMFGKFESFPPAYECSFFAPSPGDKSKLNHL